MDKMMETGIEVLGYIAFVLILAAYALNIKGRIKSSSPIYIWFNLFGGLFFAINTYYHHAYPSAILNVIWVLIAVTSLLKKKSANEAH